VAVRYIEWISLAASPAELVSASASHVTTSAASLDESKAAWTDLRVRVRPSKEAAIVGKLSMESLPFIFLNAIHQLIERGL